MKAIARFSIVCVVLAATRAPSAFAGLDGMAHGTSAAMWSTAQQEAASDAERRQVADQWLKRARQAIQEGNLDLADDYVNRAERIGANYDSLLSRFADSPAKVRRDVIEARKASGKPAAAPSQRFAPSGQTRPTTPAAENRSPGPGVPAVADESKARAQRFLDSGRQALKQGAINEAIAWRQKAVSTGASFAPGEYSPADLGRELQQAGVEPSRLEIRQLSLSDMTPEDVARPGLARLPLTDNPAASPNGANAAPPSNLQAAKDEAVRLTARAKAALDRGELNLARQLAAQADGMHVPEFAFSGNDLRPWEVLLQVDSALTRRQGVVPAGAYEAVSGADANSQGGQFPVSQGVYDPNRDATRNTLAQGLGPTPAFENSTLGAAQPVSPGVGHYQRGVEALTKGDRATAVAAFQEAWKFEQELPPDVRQQLKDKLFVLTQPANLPNPTSNEPAPLEEVSSQQQLLFQKMYREIAAEEQAAEKMTGSDPRGALQRMTALRDRVSSADLDAPAKKQLLTFVDRAIGRLETYIDANKSEIDLNERNQNVLREIEQRNLKKFEVDDTIAGKVDEFNKLMEEERFAEAELVARQVRELAPDNPISRTLLLNSKMRSRLSEQGMIKDMKEEGFYRGLAAVDESSIPFDDRQVIDYGDTKRWSELTTFRRQQMLDAQRKMTPAELQIREALKKQVEVRFDNRPLKEVLETLGSMTGVNVFVDTSGLAAEGVTSDTPVSINLSQPITLQSALNVILQPLQLGYVIRNEVLHITSEQAKDSNTYQKTYYVADLIVPIPNFVPSYNMGLPAAIREAHQTLGYGGSAQPIPGYPAGLAENGDASINANVLAQASPYNNVSLRGNRPTSPNGIFPGTMGGAALADFDTLIELVKSTISPDSWDDAGGPGAIEPFPTNLSLVISQTQDVHDQIADLLEQLRRLQDLQVAIEVRFITIRDSWFERIGVDFDFRINDNVIPPLRRDDQGPSMAIGLDPNGAPTADLDLPFTQDSFSVAIPQFGGFTATNAANFGVAILSDIEAFFLVQASTGDRRSNVLTAPKVTLFNGQSASVNDTSQRPFVIGLIPVVGDFAVAHQPVVTVLNEGTQLGVQAVVSSDRRYVRLTLVPFFSQIGDVQEFTFSGATTTDTGTNVVDANGAPTGQRDNATVARAGTTIQLPTFSFTTVSTTVSVPDGGTVLLGGIKRLSEGRNEFGVPGLNKLPYVNRLFKNVGIGRDTSSLMLMVTPRIIIQEEEEDKLGLNLSP